MYFRCKAILSVHIMCYNREFETYTGDHREARDELRRPRSVLLSLYIITMNFESSEKLLKRAIKSLQTKECPTIAAARKYGVPDEKLRRRYKNLSTSRKQAHEAQMILNTAQEKAVVQ